MSRLIGCIGKRRSRWVRTNVAGLLDELERVLVEVARGPSTVSMQQLADIQQRIESQGILFKVKVIGSEIRQQPVS